MARRRQGATRVKPAARKCDWPRGSQFHAEVRRGFDFFGDFCDEVAGDGLVDLDDGDGLFALRVVRVSHVVNVDVRVGERGADAGEDAGAVFVDEDDGVALRFEKQPVKIVDARNHQDVFRDGSAQADVLERFGAGAGGEVERDGIAETFFAVGFTIGSVGNPLAVARQRRVRGETRIRCQAAQG